MINDALSIQVNVELAEAKTTYEAWRKEMESNPIRLRFEGDAATGKGATSRSFGGQEMPGGSAGDMLHPTSYVQPSRVSMSEQMAAIHLQSLTGAGFIGGSGFNPAVVPLPTASVNTVYGNVKSDVIASAGVQHTNAEYSRYRLRALRGGIMSPMGRTDFDREGGFQTAMYELDSWQEQRIRNRSDSAMAKAEAAAQQAIIPGRPTTSPVSQRRASAGQSAEQLGQPFAAGLRNALGAYVGVQTLTAAFQSQNQLAFAQAGAMGDRAAYAQATIDNNPMAAMVGSIPLAGGLVVGALDYLSGGRQDATRTLRMSSLQDGTTGALRSIGDLRRTSALGSQYAGALASGGFSAQMAGYQMALANVEPERQLRANQLKAPIAAEVIAKEQEAKRLRDALPTALVESGWRGRTFAISRLPTKADGTLDTSGIGFTPTKSGLDAIEKYNNAQTALEDARKRMASVDDATKEIAARDLKNIETQQRLTTAYDKIDAKRIDQSAYGAVSAANAATMGFSGHSIKKRIEAQFDPQIEATRAQIAAIEAEGGTVSEAQRSELYALKKQKQLAGQQSFNELYKGVTSELGGLRAGAMGLAYRPFDAMREQANAAFKSAITSVDKDGNIVTAEQGSDVYLRAKARNTIELAQIEQNQKFQTRAIDTSLDASSDALGYRFGRNEAGARAAELAGGTINQMRELARGQFGDQAEKLRSNALRQFDLMARDEALAFRGEQFDAQNIVIAGPRDTQNPEEIFKSIEEQKQKVAGADAAPDKDTTTSTAVSKDIDWLDKNLGEIIKKAMKELVVN